MATLTYRHFGNPIRSYSRTRYTIVHKKALQEAFFLPFIVHSSSKALQCQFRRPHAAVAGSRSLAAAGFLASYM